jgi:hypothetical protein
MSVTIHCLLPGRYSKKTVVSSTRLPPAPNPLSAMKVPSEAQFGMAPARRAAIEQINSE